MFWATNILFKLMILITPMVSISLTNQLSLWIMLEVNFLSFLCLMNNMKTLNIATLLVYFLIQSLGSMLMLFSMFGTLASSSSLILLMFYVSILLKLGSAPFHTWYIKLMYKLEWSLMWMLSIWQKIIPMIFLMSSNHHLMLAAGGLSAVTGSILSIKQTKMKKIMGLSSVSSLGWMLASLVVKGQLWLIFLMSYGASIMPAFLSLSQYTNMNPNLAIGDNSWKMLMTFSFFLMASGMPPFIMFFMKITILMQMAMFSFGIMGVLLMSTLFLLFIYLMFTFHLLSISCSSKITAHLSPVVQLNYSTYLIVNILISFFLMNTMCTIT